MDGVLQETAEPIQASELRVARLLAANDQLCALIDGLQRENLELRQQVGYWRSMHARASERLETLQGSFASLEAEVRKLQADLFGRKSEKTKNQDRSNDLEDSTETAEKPKRGRGQQKDRPGPPRRDYAHLPERPQKVELPPEQCHCPDCGKPLKLRSDTEDSTQIEIEVVVWRRLIQRCRYESTCGCTAQPRFITAPPPPKLIPKGLYGTSLWVEILVDKFYGQRPTERLLESLQMQGLDLAAGTVADGLRQLAPLFTPLYAALRERNIQSVIKQADETRWFVFADHEGKRNHCWWLWAFTGEDTVVYCLDPSRSHTVPEEHFGDNVRGTLLVDRYAAYKAMMQVTSGLLLLAFCWAHVRRDFVRVGKGWPELKEWALAWLQRIRQLYRLNRQRLATWNKSAAKFAKADAALRRALAAFEQQLNAELADPKLRMPCRKVLESLQNHWEGLTRFVDDPRIPMDNNASERRLRRPVIGRKNYFGSGSESSGQLAAMLFSIFDTLKMWKLNIRKWLRWYLDSCAEAGGKAPPDINPFLPWNLTDDQRRALSEEPPPQPNTS